MRVCLVSHRLGGYDGVSIEAAKWVAGFEALGWQVTRAAGVFLDRRPKDIVVDGLWAERPGGQPPPVDHTAIRRLCGLHDLLVLDNAGSLWSAPDASVAWEHHALNTGIPTIVRHHDPAWQGVPMRNVTGETVPLHDRRHLHVLINKHTYAEFANRWSELSDADALRVVYNRVDVDGLRNGNRASTRAFLGVRAEEILIVHPARVDAAGNKNIPGAVQFVRNLEQQVNRPVRYWLTDNTVTEPGSIRDALARAPGLLRGHVSHQADLYAAADLVILPSTWEGWGLPVVEASAAGKPVVAGPYPVLSEIREFGITVYSPEQVEEIGDLLTERSSANQLLQANQTAVRRHFDLQSLPATLIDLARHSHQLANSNTS